MRDAISHGVVPELSVAAASFGPVQDALRFVSELADQCHDDAKVQVVVAHAGHGIARHFADLRRKARFELRILELEADASLPRLLGAAIASCTGSVVAVTDVCCKLHRSWLRALSEVHQRCEAAIVGGAVEPESPRSLADWAAFFCEYGQFMLPLENGPARELPGNNISFKRSTLQTGSPYLAPEFWKTYWCQNVLRLGESAVVTDEVVVWHTRRYRFARFLRRRFRHGWCFAAMRFPRAATARRLGYAVVTPLLPVLSTFRVLRAVLPKRRHLSAVLFSLPMIVAANLAWAVGEFWGYTFGSESPCRSIR